MARAYYLFSYVYWIVANETVFFLLNFFRLLFGRFFLIFRLNKKWKINLNWCIFLDKKF